MATRTELDHAAVAIGAEFKILATGGTARWSTTSGLRAAERLALIARCRAETMLDPRLWLVDEGMLTAAEATVRNRGRRGDRRLPIGRARRIVDEPAAAMTVNVHGLK